MTNEYFNVSLKSVKLWRLNFPSNCYSLDLTNNRDVREKGVKQLFLNFYILENYSVDIFPEGQSLASYRMIKAHRSQSSGDAIGLDDLGWTIYYYLAEIILIFRSQSVQGLYSPDK